MLQSHRKNSMTKGGIAPRRFCWSNQNNVWVCPITITCNSRSTSSSLFWRWMSACNVTVIIHWNQGIREWDIYIYTYTIYIYNHCFFSTLSGFFEVKQVCPGQFLPWLFKQACTPQQKHTKTGGSTAWKSLNSTRSVIKSTSSLCNTEFSGGSKKTAAKWTHPNTRVVPPTSAPRKAIQCPPAPVLEHFTRVLEAIGSAVAGGGGASDRFDWGKQGGVNVRNKEKGALENRGHTIKTGSYSMTQLL